MDIQEFASLKNYPQKRQEVITVNDLVNRSNRTLLYGYTCERQTWHVYLRNGEIIVVQYNQEYSRGKPAPKNMERISVKSSCGFIPDKRLYPERCDYEFCRILKEKGYDLPFTTWSEHPISEQEYYGFILDENQILTVDDDQFEIVDYWPLGYRIWNIGSNMPDGYLPLCREKMIQPFDGAREIETDTLKCIRIPEAQQILKYANCGGTIEELKSFVEEFDSITDQDLKKKSEHRPRLVDYILDQKRKAEEIKKILPILERIPR